MAKNGRFSDALKYRFQGSAGVKMKSGKIKVKGGRYEKNTAVLILDMMIRLACSSYFRGFDDDRLK